jgi:lysophospholipase L1-like esterase
MKYCISLNGRLRRFLSVTLFVSLLLAGFYGSAQSPRPFDKEVADLTAQDGAIKKKKIILFTGSSSIRIWKDIHSYFPEQNVLNRGFGGSTMKDMLYYTDKLIIPYRPKMIFIYEGDNDLAGKKTPGEIIASADSIVLLIRSKVSKKVPVYFFSAKPSLARWNMKDEYLAYNQKLKDWTTTKKNVKYIDVWTPMLDANGEVQKDIFLGDGLHMNKKGYDIWGRVLKSYIR